jgi:hypothetical protein
LEDVVPYVPGSAGTQLIKSVLDSSIIVTGPPPSFGITTELLGVKLSDDVVCIVQNELTEALEPVLVATKDIVAGPTKIGPG